MPKDIKFSDYIIFDTSSYESIIYNPVYSKELGLYLYNEDEKGISYISIENDKITLHYLDGETKVLDQDIISITVEDNIFKKRTKKSISGNLLYYDEEAALLYDLDMTKIVTTEIVKSNVKTRKLFKK